MNLESNLGTKIRVLPADNPKRPQSGGSWREELTQLVDRELPQGNVCEFLRSLLDLLGRWHDLRDCQNNEHSTGLEPPSVQLSDQLRQSVGLLMDRDQRRFLMPFVNEATRLLANQSAASAMRFRRQYLARLVSCEPGDRSECAPSMSVASGDTAHGEYRFPLRLSVVDSDGKEARINYTFIAIDQQQRKLEYSNEQFELGGSGGHIVDLKLSCAEGVCFADCPRIAVLDISHTFIRNLDTREFLDLKELKLMNTNVRRLNLATQGRLRFLYCNYTLLDYLLFSKHLLLKELNVEGSGELKVSMIGTDCEVIIDEQQTVDEYECKSRVETKLESYVVSYPEMREKEEQITSIIPDECNELFDRNIKECRKLKINGEDEDNKITIDSLNIVDYPNLEKLGIRYLNCDNFYISELPSLTNVEIERLKVDTILLMGLPNLQEIVIIKCDYLKQLNIEGCKNLEVLDVHCTGLAQLDVGGLRELRKLDASYTVIDYLDVSSNIKLEKLDVENTKISELDVSANTKLKDLKVNEMAALKKLDASYTELSKIDVSRNANLESLNVSGTKISFLNGSNRTSLRELNVSEMTELKKLYVYKTSITEITMTGNIKLEELSIHNTKISQVDVRELTELKRLWASNTCITDIDVSKNTKLELLSVHDTKISELGVKPLTKLKALYSENTDIHEIDVSRNTVLEELNASDTNLAELDVSELSKLKKFWVLRTNITELDLSNNRELNYVSASNNCKILNCCCMVEIED